MTEEVREPGGRLLATVLRLGGPLAGLNFFSAPEDLLQVGAMHWPAGHAVGVHQHNPVRRETEGTGEFLLVLDGLVRVDVFADRPDGSLVAKRFRLGPRDAVLFAPGSLHAVTWLTEARVVEIKSGPYPGRDEDKVTGGP